MNDLFQSVMGRAVQLMNRLKYRSKLALVGSVFFVPTLVLTIVLVFSSVSDIRRTKKEIRALDSLVELEHLQEEFHHFVDLQMMLSIDQSNTAASKELDDSRAAIRRKIDLLLNTRISGDRQGVWNSNIQAFQEQFEAQASNTVTTMANPEEIYGMYEPLGVQVKSLFNTLSNVSGLINDQEIGAYYLGSLMTNRIPELHILTSKARSFGRFAIAQVNPTSLTYDSLDRVVDELYNQEALMAQAINYAINLAPQAEATLKEPAAKAIAVLPAISDTLLEEIIEAIEISIADSAFMGKVEAQRSAIGDFSQQVHMQLDTILNQRVRGLYIALLFMLGVLVLLVGAAVFLSFALINSVQVTIDRLSQVSQAMAEGDLTVQAEIQSKDEMLALRDAFNAMSKRVNTLIQEVKKTAGEVADQAKQVETIADESSKMIDRQMENTQSVAQSVHELGGSVRQVCANTHEVAEAANNALQLAGEGRDQVNQAAHSIDVLNQELQNTVQVTQELSKRSDSINQVVDVIREIAAQTNLLSLNAAIEAARSGEHGKGFAVVAEEVRVLAKRTEEATSDIGNSIFELQTGVGQAVDIMLASRNRVEQAVQESHKVREALDQITAAVEGLHRSNAENESATEGQGRAADAIESHVEDIKESAQVSASGSSRTSESSKKMAKLADQLMELVGTFKV